KSMRWQNARSRSNWRVSATRYITAPSTPLSSTGWKRARSGTGQANPPNRTNPASNAEVKPAPGSASAALVLGLQRCCIVGGHRRPHMHAGIELFVQNTSVQLFHIPAENIKVGVIHLQPDLRHLDIRDARRSFQRHPGRAAIGPCQATRPQIDAAVIANDADADIDQPHALDVLQYG